MLKIVIFSFIFFVSSFQYSKADDNFINLLKYMIVNSEAAEEDIVTFVNLNSDSISYTTRQLISLLEMSLALEFIHLADELLKKDVDNNVSIDGLLESVCRNDNYVSMKFLFTIEKYKPNNEVLYECLSFSIYHGRKKIIGLIENNLGAGSFDKHFKRSCKIFKFKYLNSLLSKKELLDSCM
jgi:hypothetical protein